jgi:hypothetical protein
VTHAWGERSARIARHIQPCAAGAGAALAALAAGSSSSKDGRLVLVKLTAKGRKMMKQLFPEFNKGERLAIADLNRSDLGSFADLLRAVTLTADSQKAN